MAPGPAAASGFRSHTAAHMVHLLRTKRTIQRPEMAQLPKKPAGMTSARTQRPSGKRIQRTSAPIQHPEEPSLPAVVARPAERTGAMPILRTTWAIQLPETTQRPKGHAEGTGARTRRPGGAKFQRLRAPIREPEGPAERASKRAAAAPKQKAAAAPKQKATTIADKMKAALAALGSGGGDGDTVEASVEEEGEIDDGQD